MASWRALESSPEVFASLLEALCIERTSDNTTDGQEFPFEVVDLFSFEYEVLAMFPHVAAVILLFPSPPHMHPAESMVDTVVRVFYKRISRTDAPIPNL